MREFTQADIDDIGRRLGYSAPRVATSPFDYTTPPDRDYSGVATYYTYAGNVHTDTAIAALAGRDRVRSNPFDNPFVTRPDWELEWYRNALASPEFPTFTAGGGGGSGGRLTRAIEALTLELQEGRVIEVRLDTAPDGVQVLRADRVRRYSRLSSAANGLPLQERLGTR